MGQKHSTFIYSPLEFVEYKNTHYNSSHTLETFLVTIIQQQIHVKMDPSWNKFIDQTAHKIRCISEGWDSMPKIVFKIVDRDGYIPMVLKVLDGV